MFKYLSYGFVASGAVLSAGDFPPLTVNPSQNSLPPEVLAFPPHSENFREKIIEMGGDLEIWSEEKLTRWALAQGLLATADHSGGGVQWHRAAVITSPGLRFTLRRPVTEKGSEFTNGWRLNLDISSLRPRSTKHSYSNILEARVFIDGVYYQTISQTGSGKASPTPVSIEIPHIRDPEGKIEVELKLTNHPRNFLFLYDAYLTR